MSKSTHIIVRGQFEGVHCYPNAPEEVSFLRANHRHMFNYEVEIEVYHDDRELEFVLVKRNINDFLSGYRWPIQSSCEQIARTIGMYLQTCCGLDRYLTVSVFEDNENGAKVFM